MARELGGVEEAARRGGDDAREELLRVGGLLDISRRELDISRRELDISRRELEEERSRQAQLEDLLRVQTCRPAPSTPCRAADLPLAHRAHLALTTRPSPADTPSPNQAAGLEIEGSSREVAARSREIEELRREAALDRARAAEAERMASHLRWA